MSRINEMLQELCPDGVNFKHLGSIGTWYGGGTPSKGKVEYWADGTIPWVSPKDMGRRVVNSSIDMIAEAALRESAAKLVPPTSVAMVVRSSILNHTFPTALVPVPVALNQDMKAVVPYADVMADYLAHVLSSRGQDILRKASKIGGSVTSINSPQLLNYRIPVPPLEVQREIVRVLDQFTQLEAELEAKLQAELEARRRQYEHYRAQRLAEAAHAAERVALGELGRIVTGRTPKSSDALAWGTEIDFITPSDIANGMKVVSAPSRRLSTAGAASMAKVMVPARSLLVTCIGADMGKTVINEHECVTNQQINSIIPTREIVVDYFYHLLTSMRDRLRAQGERSGGTMPLINKTDFSKIEVPVPSLAVQEAVASKLNEINALISDISICLPGELNARRKQYEQYRDRLLTFKEAAA
ncbi:restriction endonuclease subunit S [Streptomyces sp. NPDC052727]|uniref:restriction endonuclease subunit S n=1 Tax=Streptomyces sp. NPDC052727 TaxID=3154854 RepID=UPI0034418BF3